MRLKQFREGISSIAIGCIFLVVSTILPRSMDAQVCWRKASGRGVGTIPTSCPSGQENDAGLCYVKCPAGMVGAGPVCWATCPAGWTNNGIGCTKPAPYGRGAGYPWKFGDKAFSLDGARARCAADHPEGCEQNGQILYPKCKAGFSEVGCCICSPTCPAGFKDAGVSCIKPSQPRGAGTIPNSCANGKQYDAGLCYTACGPGSSGVGPECWTQCPPSMPVNCGLSCAPTKAACGSAISEQTISVLDVASTIALTAVTLGSGTAAKAAVETSAKQAAKQVSTGISRQLLESQIKAQAVASGKTLTLQQIQSISALGAGEPFDPYSLDPTGIAAIVKAYNKPVCQAQ